jgi:hypothetical protein
VAGGSAHDAITIMTRRTAAARFIATHHRMPLAGALDAVRASRGCAARRRLPQRPDTVDSLRPGELASGVHLGPSLVRDADIGRNVVLDPKGATLLDHHPYVTAESKQQSKRGGWFTDQTRDPKANATRITEVSSQSWFRLMMGSRLS